MPNTGGIALHLLLWVVQLPQLRLCSKFDGLIKSTQLICWQPCFFPFCALTCFLPGCVKEELQRSGSQRSSGKPAPSRSPSPLSFFRRGSTETMGSSKLPVALLATYRCP